MPTEVRPNLFIVGAQKSGTSALAGWLSQHSQACMSFPKEPGFLAFGESGYPFLDGYGNAAPASKYVINDEHAYINLFSHATAQQHVVGEASTWYFALPGTAQKIKSYNPQARIIIILRNPVERAYSAWCHARSDHMEPYEFSAALAAESQRGEVEFLLRYKKMGLYSHALSEYQAVFPAAQILLLFYDDLRADPLATWQKVCAFLSIDAAEHPVFERKYNRSGQPRYPIVHNLLRSYRVKRFIRSFLPHRAAIYLKQQIDDINLERFPAIDPASKSELREYYRQDIEALSHLTKREFSSWLQ